MAVGIKKGHDQVAAAAAALLMVFLVAATFHFQALHARPVDASGTLHPSSHDDNTGASPPPADGGGGGRRQGFTEEELVAVGMYQLWPRRRHRLSSSLVICYSLLPSYPENPTEEGI